MDEDAELKAGFEKLQQQKELLMKAKSRTGQKPTQAMRRSRAQLEQEFFNQVTSCSTHSNTGLRDIDETL